RERTENRDNNAPPKLGLNFTEAAGKTVAYLNVINDPPSWQALENSLYRGNIALFRARNFTYPDERGWVILSGLPHVRE
ncbi:MAG TPA: hypothetical protein VI320_02100, partial [Terracidiphilus sp.]